MSKRFLILMCSISLIVPLFFMGCGSDGSNGAPGTNAPTTGNIAGVVTDNTSLNPIQGVTVTAQDSGGAVKGTATTDATGAYTLANLPLGTVTVFFTSQFFTSPGGMMVGVLGGQTVTINAALGEKATGAPSVSITGYNNGMYTTDDFGYGGTAQLAASGNDPNGDTLTYTWSNATSKDSPARGSVTVDNASNPTQATVTFPTLANAMKGWIDTANGNATVSGYKIFGTSFDRFGILPIINDARGAVSAKVTVTDGRGQSASVTLALNAASVQTSARNVPVGSRVYMSRGNDNASQTWTITNKPTGSAAALDNAALRNPSFVADAAGKYTLTAGNNTITLYAGTWKGVIDPTGATATGYTAGNSAGCRACHNDSFAVNEFDPWYATAHAKIFTLGIDNLSGTTGISCAPCHTVGFDRGTNNGGFDDLALSTGWIFPKREATAWMTMVANFPTVAALANIQCENCHGPQNSSAHTSTGPLGAIDNNNTFASDRISYSAELCGTCHAAGAGHNFYSEWSALSPDGIGHANRSRAIASGTSNHCGRCHSAQGFTVYVDQLEKGVVGVIDNVTVPAGVKFNSSITAANVEPVTCTACHDPHDAGNPNQLRVFGDTAMLPSGFQMTGVGKGALCITCHNSRNGARTGSITLTYLHEDGETYNGGNPTGYSAPHQADQGDVFAGHNAYFMGATLPLVSKHAAIEDTCVGCHMVLNPKTHLSHGSQVVDSHRFRIDDADLGTLCSNCHGTGTVNGEGIQASIEAGLANLASKITTAAKTNFNAMSDNIAVTGATDPATDTTFGTGAGNFSGALVTSVELEELHGQIAFIFNTSSPVTFGSATSSRFAVQLGNVNNATTAVAVYALSGNMVRAGWNFFLIEGDDSKGIHNPTFAQGVLNATLAQDLSN